MLTDSKTNTGTNSRDKREWVEKIQKQEEKIKESQMFKEESKREKRQLWVSDNGVIFVHNFFVGTEV